jgi:oligoribonuclease NrnB/cAMP/cGMP phosphodiesterase (DHH superfamily)
VDDGPDLGLQQPPGHEGLDHLVHCSATKMYLMGRTCRTDNTDTKVQSSVFKVCDCKPNSQHAFQIHWDGGGPRRSQGGRCQVRHYCHLCAQAELDNMEADLANMEEEVKDAESFYN